MIGAVAGAGGWMARLPARILIHLAQRRRGMSHNRIAFTVAELEQQGFIDKVLRMWQALGLIWDLRRPPADVLAGPLATEIKPAILHRPVRRTGRLGGLARARPPAPTVAAWSRRRSRRSGTG